LFLLIVGLILGGCSMPTAQPAEPITFDTPTTSPSPSPTETVQWFPPTNTPLPLSTRTVLPTNNWLPGINTLLFEENFKNPESWQILSGNAGNIVFSDESLNLAVSTPKGYLSGIKNGQVLGSFYLEIIVSAGVCRGMDTYGLILRALDGQNYYRYAVTCSGMTRLEWVQNSKVSIIQDWSMSGQVPIGAPAEIKIGVWAYRDEMRFFVNEHFQFAATGLALEEGKFGVFARSEGTTALSINFSDAAVFTLGSIPPTATPNISPTTAP